MKIIFKVLVVSMLGNALTYAGPNTPKGPVLLTEHQLDSLTAGFSSNVDVYAAGISQIFSATQTDAVAIATVTTADQPHLGAVVGISGGEASAVAVGEGSDTETAVNPSSDISGSNVNTYRVDVYMKGQIVEINGSGMITVGSIITNPL